ncbi:MAG: hypothetical protein JNM63_01890, partial [Spirochaetia bacterium]|nr:hypothetical protein [Spirochaetia bacterium]
MRFSNKTTQAGIVSILSASFFFHSCRTTPAIHAYPLKLEKVQQLVLTTKTDRVSFEERIKKNILPPFLVSQALIRVDGEIAVDYFLDLEHDAPRVQFNPESKEIRFTGGPIRVKRPLIVSSKVFIVEKGIWVNEEKEARLILEHLTDRLAGFGEAWLKDETVRTNAEHSLR